MTQRPMDCHALEYEIENPQIIPNIGDHVHISKSAGDEGLYVVKSRLYQHSGKNINRVNIVLEEVSDDIRPQLIKE